jgi:hypothetical protein
MTARARVHVTEGVLCVAEPQCVADGANTRREKAQRLENGARKPGQLVEEEHRVVYEAHLAGAGNGAAADETGVGDGMVGERKGRRERRD